MASAGEWQMFKFYSHFNMRASYIDQNEVAQIRINMIAVWNEVILKYLFPHLLTMFDDLGHFTVVLANFVATFRLYSDNLLQAVA